MTGPLEILALKTVNGSGCYGLYMENIKGLPVNPYSLIQKLKSRHLVKHKELRNVCHLLYQLFSMLMRLGLLTVK
jgi:hypothetical protein